MTKSASWLTPDLMARAKQWAAKHDGGALWPHNSDILAISWESGGQHELGHFYEGEEDKAEFICEVFNVGLEMLLEFGGSESP